VYPQECSDPTPRRVQLGQALLYFVSNNLNFLIIRELDPVAFQILNNLKILTTAVLYRIMMKVELSPLQWRMLIVLTGASVLSQVRASPTSWPIFSEEIAMHALPDSLASSFTRPGHCRAVKKTKGLTHRLCSVDSDGSCGGLHAPWRSCVL
jgi:hypothetical protein